VASFSGSSWTVARRADDFFSTAHSIFGAGADGHPVALRDVGGTLSLGRWDGADWVVEEVGQTATVGEGDQLYSGLLQVNAQGDVYAVFVTESEDLYFAAVTATGKILAPIPEGYRRCYDLALSPDGRPLVLYAEAAQDVTSLGTLNENGELVPEELPEVGSACGSIAVSDLGEKGVVDEADRVGVVTWTLEDSGSGTVRLREKSLSDPAATWSNVVAANDGGFNTSCAYCNVPEMAYRGDGKSVMIYVSSTSAVFVLEQAEDGTFNRNMIAGSNQPYQLTRLKHAPDGSLGTAVILDNSAIFVAESAADGFSLNQIGVGVSVNTPRMVYSSAGPVVSYFEADGLGAYIPDGTGAFTAFQVDTEINDGYQLGAFITVSAEGIPSVFYNEIHALE
jgi:hypothetical protein